MRSHFDRGEAVDTFHFAALCASVFPISASSRQRLRIMPEWTGKQKMGRRAIDETTALLVELARTHANPIARIATLARGMRAVLKLSRGIGRSRRSVNPRC